MKEHPLRQVDLDQVGTFDWYDMAVVDMNRVAGVQAVRYFLAVLAGQYFGALAESRTDLREAGAIPNDEIELAARDAMRNRWERRTGLFGVGCGRRD